MGNVENTGNFVLIGVWPPSTLASAVCTHCVVKTTVFTLEKL